MAICVIYISLESDSPSHLLANGCWFFCLIWASCFFSSVFSCSNFWVFASMAQHRPDNQSVIPFSAVASWLAVFSSILLFCLFAWHCTAKGQRSKLLLQPVQSPRGLLPVQAWPRLQHSGGKALLSIFVFLSLFHLLICFFYLFVSLVCFFVCFISCFIFRLFVSCFKYLLMVELSDVHIWHSLGSSRKSVHERHKNSYGRQV